MNSILTFGATLILVLFSVTAGAQNDNDIYIKAYTQFNYASGTEVQSSTLNFIRDSFTVYDFSKSTLGLSPAIQWSNLSGGTHEIGITQFGWDKLDDKSTSTKSGVSIPTGGAEANEYKLGLRYEYIRNFNIFRKESPFDFFLSMGAIPTFYAQRTKPVTSNSFSSHYASFDVNILLTPRLTYSFSEKWFLDLNIPVSGANMKY